MAGRIYDVTRRKSNARKCDELAAAIRAIAPAVNTLAEEARRRTVIRTCQIIARRERRSRHKEH